MYLSPSNLDEKDDNNEEDHANVFSNQPFYHEYESDPSIKGNDEKLDLSTILSHASKVEKKFEEPLISSLELFEKSNNGEKNIYVSACFKILSCEPIYDEYSDEMEERPFESVFT